MNSTYWDESSYQISTETDNFDFWDQICPKRGIFSLKLRKWAVPLKPLYLDYSRYKITAQTENFGFLNQICSKGVFPFKNGKSEHHYWILHIGIFQLKVTILVFWIKFTQKGYFWSATEKVNITIEFWILEYFSLSWQFWFFESNLRKRGISSLKLKKMSSSI